MLLLRRHSDRDVFDPSAHMLVGPPRDSLDSVGSQVSKQISLAGRAQEITQHTASGVPVGSDRVPEDAILACTCYTTSTNLGQPCMQLT